LTTTGQRARLDFVVIGAQRAGSTELSARLRAHPGIFLRPDEVPYFEDPFFANSSPRALDPVLMDARPGQVAGLHCPSYLGHPEVAARIADFAPGARIVVVLREPVSRAISLYFWYVQFGMLPLIDLASGIRRLLDGWTDPAYPHAHEVLDWGFYGRHLQRYVDVFPADQQTVLLIEDLVDPASTLRLHEFLGVDPSLGMDPHARHLNAGVYDLRRLRFLRTRRRWAWSWADTTAYEYRPRRLRKPLQFVPNAAIVGFDRYVLSRLLGNAKPSLPAELKAELHDLYADDLRLVERLTGRDLSSWREPGPGPTV